MRFAPVVARAVGLCVGVIKHSVGGDSVGSALLDGILAAVATVIPFEIFGVLRRERLRS